MWVDNPVAPEKDSADVDGDATLVPTTIATHVVRQLGTGTTRADAAGWRTEFPGRSLMTVTLHFGFFLLWYWHRSLGFRCIAHSFVNIKSTACQAIARGSHSPIC